MKVGFIRSNHDGEEVVELILEPQGPRDEETLDRLLQYGYAIGFGRNAKTCEIEHLTVEVKKNDN